MWSFVFDQQRQVELYGKDERRQGDAERQVKTVEYAASMLGSLDEAYDIVGYTEEEYGETKKLLEKEAATDRFLPPMSKDDSDHRRSNLG